MKLLMISGDRALAFGKRGAFYNTLEELHPHFERIDIICPRVSMQRYNMVVFGNVHVHPSPLPLLCQPFWIWWKGRALIRRFAHELMTVHEYPPFYNGIGARLLHAATGVLYVLELFHIPGVPRASGLKERFYRWLTRQIISWDAAPARVVRVMNQRQVPAFLKDAGVPLQKIRTMPAVYIDTNVFALRDTPKLYDVAFVGRMASNKGINLYLEVIERLGCVGVAVGEGPLLSWARRQAKRRGLKIHFPGFAVDSTEVARYLNESRVLLMPSFNEGGPRIVVESLACGTPVVATPVGIVEDVLPPECIEEWNASDLADKVRNILDDATLYRRLSEQGVATAQPFERSVAITNLVATLQSYTQ